MCIYLYLFIFSLVVIDFFYFCTCKIFLILFSHNLTFAFNSDKPKKLHGQNEMEIAEDVSSEYMADCCPSLCYFCCSFCKADENPVLWQNWADVRCRLYCFVETRFFRVAVSVIILTSIIMLVSTFLLNFHFSIV